ncbi:MAG: DUF177 domain-containing protein [Bdellovibrionota bacterium]
MKQKESTTIRIDDIPIDRALEYDQEFSLEALNERMNLGVENDIIFTQAPKVSLTIKKNKGGAELKGTISTSFVQPCGRCTDEIERPILLELNFLLKPASEDTGELGEEDLGIIYYDSDHIDIEDLVQETLIISMSAYWLPPKDKDDKCTVCNKVFKTPLDAEEKKGLNLGELMKKAGIGDN